MFFTGLFSSHIPYIILAAVYSLSFGIFSFYYISNKFSNKEQAEKKIELSDNIHSDTGDFHFKDHYSHNESDNSFISVIPPDHRSDPISSIIIKRNSPRKAIIISPHHEFRLFSRPPPAAWFKFHNIITAIPVTDIYMSQTAFDW